MTFLEMQTDALDLLQELQNHPQYSVTKLKQYLNRGSVAFVRKTKCIEGTINITTVSDQFEYTETDEATLVSIYLPYQFRYVVGTEVGDILKPYPGGYTNLPKTYQYGTPAFYWIRNLHSKSTTDPATTIGVRVGTWPIAHVADVTLRIDAFLWPTTMVENTATPEYKDAWHDAPVYYAVARFFGTFSHLRPAWREKAATYMNEFERLVAEAHSEMMVQSDEPIEIEDVYGQMDRWDY